MATDDVLQDYAEGDTDPVKEYFRLKKAAKDLRDDLKDITMQHKDYPELQKALKVSKKIRDDIKEDDEIKEKSEKVKEIKERMGLLMEMIRIRLIENSEEEVKDDGKVLRLVYVVKEGKDQNA